MLPGLGGADVPLGVQRVRQWVVDDRDVGVVDDGGIRLVDPLDPVLGSELLSPSHIASGHGHEAVPRGRSRFDDAEGRDAGRAEDADAQRLGAR